VRSAPQFSGDGHSDTGTRRLILVVASELFAYHGYHGTTTRDIAEGVGIRQPSLFHHFPSKAAIMEALLEQDLSIAVKNAERIARSPDPASIRLYRYLATDIAHVAGSPYNLAGVYTEEVRASEEFEPWHRKRRRLHRAIERIVREGIESREFIQLDPTFVRETILGILGRTLAHYSGGQAKYDPKLTDQVPSFVLRALLADPERLGELRQQATEAAV
jgi:AcrR family transcriptional regulator